MEAQGRRRETSRHRSAPRFAAPVGRTAAVLTPLLSLGLPVLLLVVVQSLSAAAQRVPTGAARFDAAGAWLATEPGALAGAGSWLSTPLLGRVQLGLLVRALQGGQAQGVLAAAHGGMLLLTVLQAVLLWWVLRRLGTGGVAAGLAVAAFGIVPVAVETHSAVSATSVAVVWLLLAAVLALGRSGRSWIGAGAAAGVAVLSQPAVGIALVPLAVLLLVRRRGAEGDPAPARPAFGLGLGLAVAAALLGTAAAVLSALPATAATARLDRLVDAQDAAPTLGLAAVARWVQVDPLSAVVAVAAVVLAGAVGRDRGLAAVAAVLVAAAIWPGGGDAVAPTLVLLPVVAVAVARASELGVAALGHPAFARSVLGSFWLTGVAALLVVAAIAWLVGLSALVPGRDQPVAAAARWLDRSVPPGQTVLVGLGAWPDLAQRTRADVGWYAGDRGSGTVPSSVPWGSADYVVEDASLPAHRSGAAAAVLDRSLRVATFGSGGSAIAVLAVRAPAAAAPAAPPTTAAGREAQRVRREVGAQLARNPRVELGGRDRARLLAGQVDSRVALVLAQFVTAHRVAVSGFGVAAGDRSGVRTTVTIREIDGRRVPADGTKTGVLLRFLSDLRGDFATRSIDATDDGITATFAPDLDLVPSG